jgi:hypothetical protein
MASYRGSTTLIVGDDGSSCLAAAKPSSSVCDAVLFRHHLGPSREVQVVVGPPREHTVVGAGALVGVVRHEELPGHRGA